MDDNRIYDEKRAIINYKNSDFTKIEDSVKSIGVKIEAARSGRINRNMFFYTPRSMRDGVSSLLSPYQKQFREEHEGWSLGPITDAVYVEEMFPKASKKFLKLVKDIQKFSNASDGVRLVKAVKELIKSPEYNDPEYKGLGLVNIFGEIYNPKLIYELKANAERGDSSVGKVSIGGMSSEVYCSVCCNRIVDTPEKPHEHQRGKYYEGDLCFYIGNNLILDHCGFVTVPADPFTNTSIVRDALQDDLEIDIINYNKDSTENLMNIEQLKEKVKDIDGIKSVISELISDESKVESAVKQYEDNLPHSRGNHFLISSDKVLNLRTPVGVAVAEKLINELEESEEKSYLQEVLENAKETHDIEDTSKALEDYLADQDKTETEETPQEDTKEEQPETKVQDSLSVEAIVAALTPIIQEAVQSTMQEAVKVKDSVDKGILKDELKSLRENSKADELALKQMQEDYSATLVEQIRLLKGGELTPEYESKLAKRSLSDLKVTLEDLAEAYNKLHPNSEPVKLEQSSTEEVVEKIEQENTKEDKDTKPEETEEVSTEEEKGDETEEGAGDEGTKVTDSVKDPKEWLAKRMKEVSFKQAMAEYNDKFTNK